MLWFLLLQIISCAVYYIGLLTCLISSADNAPGKSCLLAKINNVAPANLYNKKKESS